MGQNQSISETRTAHVHNDELNATYKYASNRVVTAKYTIYNWLPKFLFESFQKFANTYFFIIGILQMVDAVTITNGIPYNFFPLSVVLTFELIAAMLEDSQRHRDDNVANSSKSRVIGKNGTVTVKKWYELKVGNLIKLHNYESIPSDCLILAASDEPSAAVCYVETKSLDGETNLKLRQGLVEIAEKASKELKTTKHSLDYIMSHVQGKVKFEQPNPNIEKFSGACKITLDTNQLNDTVDIAVETEAEDNEDLSTWTPLNANMLLLRGCVLRNTDFAYALILNTGHDTKIMQSSGATKLKLSDLDRSINRQIIGFVIAEMLLCVAGAVMSYYWSKENSNAYYIGLSVYDVGDVIAQTFTFFLLVSNVIPISLYVAMKFARFCQAFYIRLDSEIHYKGEDLNTGELLNIKTNVRTMDLNDALGQISYIFSDKTGTLTNNVMEFRKCSIHGISYGYGSTVIGVAALERTGQMKEANRLRAKLHEEQTRPHPRYVNFIDGETSEQNSLGRALTNSNKHLTDFFTALAVCHSVLIERIKDDNNKETGQIRLSASSPDDQALVAAASQFGFEFIERGDGGKTISICYKNPEESSGLTYTKAITSRHIETFELLEVLEFTSTRKRMSVIIKSKKTGIIKLICKGADSEIMKRLSNSVDGKLVSTTNDHLLQYANDGLRTLAIASKTIDGSTFKTWHHKFQIATADIKQQELFKDKKPNQIDELQDEIEIGMHLLGATGIEDKLQDNVPETIALLAEAGIKIWVLTGDKEETAINIGFAAQLLNTSMQRIVINSSSASTEEEMTDLLSKYKLQYFSKRRMTIGSADEDIALIIDGAALLLALTRNNKKLFYTLASQCKAVIACRTSPNQKSEIVYLVKKFDKISKTLAVGDGANDVSMIQAAHVGVGISGQEGMQAVNSSDYSIAQFKYLKRLILVHGRNNYRRMSKLIVYMFYKNIVLILAQLWWSMFNGYSGQKFYMEMSLQLYNLVFTNFPIFLLAIYDKDIIDDDVLLRIPELYEIGLYGTLFNSRVFWQSVLNGIYHSIICFSVPYLFFDVENSLDLWMLGSVVFTLTCYIVNIKAAMEQGSWRISNILMFTVTFLSWPLMAFLFDHWFIFEDSAFFSAGSDFAGDYYFVYTNMVKRLDFWCVIMLGLVAALWRDFLWKFIKREYFPELYHIVQREEHELMATSKGRRIGSIRFKDLSKPPSSRQLVAKSDLIEYELTSVNDSVMKRMSIKDDKASLLTTTPAEDSSYITASTGSFDVDTDTAIVAPVSGYAYAADEATQHDVANMIRHRSLSRLRSDDSDSVISEHEEKEIL